MDVKIRILNIVHLLSNVRHFKWDFVSGQANGICVFLDVQHLCNIHHRMHLTRELGKTEKQCFRRNAHRMRLAREWEKGASRKITSRSETVNDSQGNRVIFSNDEHNSSNGRMYAAAISFSFDQSVENAVRRIYSGNAFGWFPHFAKRPTTHTNMHTHTHEYDSNGWSKKGQRAPIRNQSDWKILDTSWPH